MTKYIDLIRQHQQAKKKGGSATPEPEETSNPYSITQDHDETLLDAMDELVEEEEVIQVGAKPLVLDEAEHTSQAEEAPTTTTKEVEPKAQDIPASTAETEKGAQPTETTKVASTPTNNPEKKDITTTDKTQAADPAPAKVSPTVCTTKYDDKTSAWLQTLNRILFSIFEAAQDDKPLVLDALESHLQQFFSNIQTTPDMLSALELEINRNVKTTFASEHHVADLVQKSIMMMLYTIKVGLHLKLQYQELLPHTLAAMLHHIGMAMVSPDIRMKTGKLSKDEIAQIRQAPEKALAYVQASHIDHEQLMLAISQSAERYDGSGPTGLTGHEIAWIARLTGLLSMFEALIHFRPYRQRLLPRDAIREIVKHHKKAFDPVMLKALIESISLYPVGTYVQINTGEVGQVINVHSKFPLRPVVYINMDKYGNLITERRIDLKQQPNLMIQKCMYEEGLEELREEQA